MTVPAQRAPEARRPRVVMLVANGVKGDSRVQKIAWSMAAAGWEVTLVGRAPGAEPERYRLGAAEVLLVPVPKTVSAYEGARLRGGRRAAALRPAYREARAALAGRDAAAGRRRRSRGVAAARRFLAARPGLDALLARCSRGPLGGAAHQALGTVLGGLDRHGGWRWFNPWFADLDLALAPVVRDLEPDLIHAHDFHMVGIGARLAAALSTDAHPVRWIYDAHEYLRGIEVPSRTDIRLRMRRRMLVGVESEYIGRADAVVTVSEGIAQRLAEDHALSHRPGVILNAPVIAAGDGMDDGPTTPRSLRADCGIEVGTGAGTEAAEDVPLLLYSGGMSPRRGVSTAVEALVCLPQAHLALIARTDDPDIPALTELAERLGVAGRLHVVPYVPVDQVVSYISAATIGLVPILHLPNHELSLITKYFEYLHACLPIVTSDVREMAAETRRLGVGEVFAAGDAVDLAAAVTRVLAEPERYRGVYSGPSDPRPASSWAGQAERLDALYRSLVTLAPGPARDAGALELRPIDATVAPLTRSAESPRAR
ncbi:glycosyltransferase [Actinospica durhamensis]|uniref:Glycosyltransferase n=1 Tax=Actinospica durhamensis TaxID=1508375 RepID=A0A941F164_9ACTN|nr:glycosyltransferase [Actinospica durhamensis]MBR7838849.1 glycosyltransferase [Actinospica durhamensis]